MITNLPSVAPAIDATTGHPLSQSDWESPHLVFAVDSQPYACPLTLVGRLMRYADAVVNPSPVGSPSWEVGSLEAGDSSLPVISLRTLWQLPPLENQGGNERQALVVASIKDQPTALLVDSCLCVLSSLPFASGPFHVPPALKGAHGDAFQTITPWKGSLLVTLALDQLIETNPPGPPAHEPDGPQQP
jgi:chemotaxis signal transduction protein